MTIDCVISTGECLSTAMSVVLLVSMVLCMGCWTYRHLSDTLITLIDRAAWEMHSAHRVCLSMGQGCIRVETMSVY